LKSRKQVKRDILTYRGLDGNIKVNPFAKACYDYMLDIYERLDDAETAKEYFEETLLPFAANGAIVYVEADEIRQKAMNENRFDESILSEFMNRDLFTADKKMLCDKIKLVDKQRHNRK
jgi:hypothetical protein